jgi:hypothetical protein
MSRLSEVSVLMADRAADLEAAHEVFSVEIQEFVQGVLSSLRRIRAEPWIMPRVRIDLPREVDAASRAGARITDQFAVARAELRFKKGVKFMPVAEISFGIEFDEVLQQFAWRVMLVPSGKYMLIDDRIWALWNGNGAKALPPGSEHLKKANTVRFVLRKVSSELSAETAFNDAKMVLDFAINADAVLASVVGVESGPGDDALPVPPPSAPPPMIAP